MQLHADLTVPALVHADALDWVPSPMPGVDRRRIARVGDEVARVTSLVRYAPNSTFSPHTHGGGEEFLVLEGTFADDLATSPAGTWVCNGVGSRHTPRIGPDGCLIFVKLWWLHPEETDSARVDTNEASWASHGPHRQLALHEGPFDRTTLFELGSERPLDLQAEGGLEVFVLDGEVHVDGGGGAAQDAHLPRWGWLRHPGPHRVRLSATEGAKVYVKQGHLRNPPPLPDAAQP